MIPIIETEIAEKFADAAKQYESNPGAMHLCGMNMLFEGLKAVSYTHLTLPTN